MTRALSLTALRTFESAARLSSFKLAATELSLSTSAISHQIRTLEENLDVVLFTRHAGGVALTEAGRVYLEHVRLSLDQLAQGAEALKQLQRQDQIRISLLSSFSTLWLIPNLVQFSCLHPGIKVELDDDPGIVDFSAGLFDAAIRYDFSGNGQWQQVITHPLFEEWIVPVCSPEYLQRNPEIVNLDFDERHTLLINKRHPDEWDQWFQSLPESPAPPIGDCKEHCVSTMMDTSNMTLMAASKGLGLALGRTPFVDQYLASSELVRVHSGVQFRGVRHYLVYPAKSSNIAGFPAFRDWIVEQARICNAQYRSLG